MIPINKKYKLILQNFESIFDSKIIEFIMIIASIVCVYFFIVNIYMLNKGFSIWDEGYYLLSYQMAALEGFYPHFNNTPFIVAKFFEWMHPGVLGYRLIHMALNLSSALLLTPALIYYLKSLEFKCNKVEKLLLYTLAIFAAAYSYHISVPTLSYNHLNEFFLIISQALLIFALVRKSFNFGTITLLLMSGVSASFDVFVKPPTFIIMVLTNIFFIIICCYKKNTTLKYLSQFLIGLVISLTISLLCILQPNEWAKYFSFMQAQTTHSPYEVLTVFFRTAIDMLRSGSGLLIASLIAILLASNRKKVNEKVTKPFYISLIFVAFCFCTFFLIKILLPKEIYHSFDIHWWFLWVYSGTILFIITIICSMSALISSETVGIKSNRLRLYIIFVLLAINPIALSIGTVNGFGQVQMHLISWALLIGISFIILLRISCLEIKLYSSVLTILSILIPALYFTRKISENNFFGQSAINKSGDFLNEEGPLKGIWIDRPTHDLLLDVNTILSHYPNASTLVFFDAPGLQYAIGRPSAVLDPWLTNLQNPPTRDDAYNCRVMTQNPGKLKQTIFIVVREKDIREELRTCLVKIGYPDQLIFLGNINTTVGSITEPIKIYFHP